MRIIKCTNKGKANCSLSENEVENVAGELKSGKLIVYPTETLYGIGANAFDESAVKRVFVIKKRPFDMPLSVAVSGIEMLESVAVLDKTSRKLVQNLMLRGSNMEEMGNARFAEAFQVAIPPSGNHIASIREQRPHTQVNHS